MDWHINAAICSIRYAFETDKSIMEISTMLFWNYLKAIGNKQNNLLGNRSSCWEQYSSTPAFLVFSDPDCRDDRRFLNISIATMSVCWLHQFRVQFFHIWLLLCATNSSALGTMLNLNGKHLIFAGIEVKRFHFFLYSTIFIFQTICVDFYWFSHGQKCNGAYHWRQWHCTKHAPIDGEILQFHVNRPIILFVLKIKRQ